jgi:predicted branched-subunit amino acid permease
MATAVSLRSILTTSLPAAAAIAVFGTLYGAGARTVLGVPLTLASSLVVFSGALQFALVALLSAGATSLPLILTALALNLRHVVLGAVLRPRIGASRLRRAALAFFLVDETFGFAIAAGNSAEQAGRAVGPATERTLLVSGAVCYLAWQVGTLVGVLGAGLAVVESVAGAIFPVLFIGLASLAVTRRSDAVRALAAAAVTVVLALALPDMRVLAPVVAGVVTALPGEAR